MPRRFAVILVADVVDYTLMMGEDADAAITVIRKLRDSSLEPIVTGNGGEVLKRMGDGWIIAFSSVDGAIKSALEVQQGLAETSTARLRMGLHMGDIVEDEADIYGGGLNLASRLQTEAPPGGIMISADLHRQLPTSQTPGFVDAGEFRLKNISQPVHAFQWRPETEAVSSRSEDVPVIAVEAFVAAPANEETASAAEDLRAQIIHDLSKRTGVSVQDAEHKKGGAPTYSLLGRLRFVGGRARANLSLVLGAGGETRWSQRYESETDDLFDFSDEVAGQADADLRLFINSLDNTRIEDLPDEVLSVSELRTRCASLFYQTSIPALMRCCSVMERACRLNPNDSMALAMWAEAYREVYTIRFEEMPMDLKRRVGDALDRSVELTPQSDFVFNVRSQFRSDVLRDAAGAIADADRSLSINPNFVLARSARGGAYSLAGDFTRAIEDFEATTTRQTTDTMWSHRTCFLTIVRYLSGDLDGALGNIRELIDLRPSIRAYRRLYAHLLQEAGELDLSNREKALAATLSGDPNYHVQPLPLPESDLWVNEFLAPDKEA